MSKVVGTKKAIAICVAVFLVALCLGAWKSKELSALGRKLKGGK